jgi:hypothetical protein
VTTALWAALPVLAVTAAAALARVLFTDTGTHAAPRHATDTEMAAAFLPDDPGTTVIGYPYTRAWPHKYEHPYPAPGKTP